METRMGHALLGGGENGVQAAMHAPVPGVLEGARSLHGLVL